jgi:triacylglycerol lipase
VALAPTRRAALLAATVACVLAGAVPAAQAGETKLSVPIERLRAGLKCTDDIHDAKRTPAMLVTGTAISGDEAYAIAKPALDRYGAPVCWVNFPNNTTADVQVSVQYLVYGLRKMHKRAKRGIVMFGISQGGLLARTALTYWPSLRLEVTDAISIAGTQHGTTVSRFDCGEERPCVPAAWQQHARSSFLAALNNGRDETPGPTSWTTVRSATDETVRPTTGPRPTSSLAGAVNILIQDVCPGREVSHFGTAVDSVTFEAIVDALEHPGPADPDRFPKDVCSHKYATGLDEERTDAFLAGGSGLAGSRYENEPRVTREPKVRSWARR